MIISPEQIKAARAWMGWTREYLAEEAGVSTGTIRNIEDGKVSPRSVEPIRLVFESKGFKFYGRHGLSRQPSETKTFAGPDSCDEFYQELLSIAKQKGGEIVAIFRTQQQLARALGVTDFTRHERLEQLAKHAVIKCLLSEDRELAFNLASIHFRATPHNPFGPMAQIVYGDTTIIIVGNGREFFFHITKSVETANSGLKDFASRWEAALPLLPMIEAAE